MVNGDTGGRLTTHVLDTMSGRPAARVKVELFRIEGARRERLASTRTNDDGRCDAPLLEGEDFTAGIYELVFHVGAYFSGANFSRAGAAAAEPAFLDQVPIRFGVAARDRHHHVPLLIAPYGYTTYRGS